MSCAAGASSRGVEGAAGLAWEVASGEGSGMDWPDKKRYKVYRVRMKARRMTEQTNTHDK